MFSMIKKHASYDIICIMRLTLSTFVSLGCGLTWDMALAQVHLTSSPAWTQRKGQPAETIRATKAAGCAPGPGYYAPETRVEKPGRHRVCRNAGQFSLIFSRIVTSPPLPRCKSETASACSFGTK